MCWNALVSATLEEFLLSSKWPCCDCAPYFFFLFKMQSAQGSGGYFSTVQNFSPIVGRGWLE